MKLRFFLEDIMNLLIFLIKIDKLKVIVIIRIQRLTTSKCVMLKLIMHEIKFKFQIT